MHFSVLLRSFPQFVCVPHAHQRNTELSTIEDLSSFYAPATKNDLRSLLQQYEDACNRYDIDAAVAMFADDGYIEINGKRQRSRHAAGPHTSST